MTARGLGVVAVVIFLVVDVAGCGGGGQEHNAAAGSTRSGEISKAEYIEEADATCVKDSREIRHDLLPYLHRAARRGSHAAAAKEMIDKALFPGVMNEIRSVRALVLPTRDIGRVARFLDALQEVIEGAREDPLAFTHASRPFSQPERLGQEYGFTVCGRL